LWHPRHTRLDRSILILHCAPPPESLPVLNHLRGKFSSVIRVETKVQRIIVALIVTVVLGLAYASGALAADMTVPPLDFSRMGKAPPDFP
jgi:hypothetical protein